MGPPRYKLLSVVESAGCMPCIILTSKSECTEAYKPPLERHHCIPSSHFIFFVTVKEICPIQYSRRTCHTRNHHGCGNQESDEMHGTHYLHAYNSFYGSCSCRHET